MNVKRILIGLAMGAGGAGVALGVRGDLVERPGVEVRVGAGAETPAEAVAGAAASEAAPAERAGVVADAAGADGRDGIAAGDGAAASAETAASRPAATPGGGVAPEARAGETTPAAAPAAAAGPTTADDGESDASERVPAQTPDAETVLRRASAAYERVRSLQADFVQEAVNPLLRNRVKSRGTLYQRRPDRFLMRFSEPAGDVIVSDGRDIWIYYPSVDEAQVIRAPAGAGGAGGVDLQAQFLGDPIARFRAELQGTEPVAGRPAHVLLLTPRTPMGYRSLKVWVDAKDYLVRRFELVENNGLTRHFELQGLSVNPTLADSLFRFTPPAGARIVDRG